MTTPSPLCTVNGNPTPVDVAVSSAVTGALASTAGAQFWTLTCTDTDETTTIASITASLSVNQGAKTFAFTAPGSLGAAVQFTSTVGVMGLGLDANGVKQPAFTTTFKVNVRAANGLAVATANETVEQNATYGWTTTLNAAARSTGTLIPKFVTDMVNIPPPPSGRQVWSVDGYAAVGDGGHGRFHWDPNFSGTPDSSINIRPTGAISGAWRRELDGELKAAMFGGVGNGSNASSPPTGTDDTNALQAMLDFNPALSVNDDAGLRACLNTTKFKTPAGLVDPFSAYRITRPLQMNDAQVNQTTDFYGDAMQNVTPSAGLLHLDFIGPAIIAGPCGTTLMSDFPAYVSDPSGSGLPMVLAGQRVNAALDSSMNTLSLPQATVTLSAAPQQFAYAGSVMVTTSLGPQLVKYTGKSGNSLTGCTGGAGVMSTGGLVAPMFSPQWNLSDTRLGDLSGVTAFTFEAWVNPGDSTAWMNAHFPSAFTSSWFGCEGQTGNVEPLHTSFYLSDNNVGGARQIQFFLTTTSTTYTVQTSGTADHTGFSANTLHSVVFQWDGTNLDMWIDGARPVGTGDTGHLTTLGTLAQKDYESLTILSGRGAQWPFRGQVGGVQPAAAGMAFGPFRFSPVARYTSGTTITVPNPATLTNDANTRWLQTFDASHIPTRPALQGFNIGQTGQGPGSLPVWLKNYTNQVPYRGNSRVRRMAFLGIGPPIHANTQVNSEFGEDCVVVGNDQGIILDSFSYNSGIGANFRTTQLGASTTTHNYLSFEIFCAPGCQFTYIKERGAGGFGATNWGIIAVFSDVTIFSRFPNQYKKGAYAFLQGISTVYLNGASILDDATGGYSLCGALFCPAGGPATAALYWTGGYIGMAASTTPIMIIGNADTSPCPVELNTTVIAGLNNNPLFSFRGTADGSQPAVWGGANASGSTPLLDTAHPGPVVDKRQSVHGRQSIAVAGNMTLSINQCFYGYTLFTGALGAGATVTQPCHIVGRRFKVRNTTGQAVTYQANTGTGIAVANNTTVDLYDDGTNVVAA